MGLIKEPKHIDFSTKSEPWTEQELSDFRKLMAEIKAKNKSKKTRSVSKKMLLKKSPVFLNAFN